MPKAFISVLIDTYNQEKFIEQAVVSALEQDFAPADREVLVVDDGSTDGTPDVVRKFAPHVRLLRKTNGGQASAFNAGIAECRGEIVAFLDGDDWWEKGKLLGVTQAFARETEIGAIGHGLFEVNEAGERQFLNLPDREYRNSLRDVREAQEFLELRSFLGTSRMAIRRSLLDKIGPVPAALVIEADEYLATMCAALQGVLILDQPLTNYRLHAGNLFQASTRDESKLERKRGVLHYLAHDMCATLAKQGVPENCIEVLRKSNWLDAERLRLTLGRGWPWDTVRAERLAYRLRHRRTSSGYRLFQAAVLTAAALLPPRQFYRLHRWYSMQGLSHVRNRMGEATPVSSLVVRRALDS